MKNKCSTLFGTLALSAVCLMTGAYAAEPGMSQDMSKPMGVTTDPQAMITPPVGPKVSHGADLFLTADFIYHGFSFR